MTLKEEKKKYNEKKLCRTVGINHCFRKCNMQIVKPHIEKMKENRDCIWRIYDDNNCYKWHYFY